MSAPTPLSPNGAGAGGEGTRVQASSNSIRGKARGLAVLRCMASFLLAKLKGSKCRGLERATARREPTFLVTKGKVGSLVCQHSNVTAVELGLGVGPTWIWPLNRSLERGKRSGQLTRADGMLQSRLEQGAKTQTRDGTFGGESVCRLGRLSFGESCGIIRFVPL